eukprot:m.214265 g.214265  ORF g.214265 m.214265 type:complete len:106 (-) comp26185_c0_seq2:748-1065(-)
MVSNCKLNGADTPTIWPKWCRSVSRVYDEVKAETKTAGFAFVAGFYRHKISGDPVYSHNMAWIVQAAQEFINRSVLEEQKPFFLYLSPTLPNNPNAAEALPSHST